MERDPKISSVESGNRKLVYMNEFRKMLREKPGFIRRAMELMNQAVDNYNPESFEYRPNETVRYDKESNTWLVNIPGSEPVKDEHGQPVLDEHRKVIFREFDEQPFCHGRGALLVPGDPIADQKTGLRVTLLGRSNREFFADRRQTVQRVDITDYFRIDVNNKSYFVKYSEVTQNPGFNEFESAQQAKKLLVDLDFVEVVEAHLGYQDDKRSWYVASWKDLENAGHIPYSPVRISNDYGEYIERPRESELPVEKYEEIERKLRAKGLDFDLSNNLFFIPNTERFFLLDVTSENAEGIGNPYRPYT